MIARHIKMWWAIKWRNQIAPNCFLDNCYNYTTNGAALRLLELLNFRNNSRCWKTESPSAFFQAILDAEHSAESGFKKRLQRTRWLQQLRYRKVRGWMNTMLDKFYSAACRHLTALDWWFRAHPLYFPVLVFITRILLRWAGFAATRAFFLNLSLIRTRAHEITGHRRPIKFCLDEKNLKKETSALNLLGVSEITAVCALRRHTCVAEMNKQAYGCASRVRCCK